MEFTLKNTTFVFQHNKWMNDFAGSTSLTISREIMEEYLIDRGFVLDEDFDSSYLHYEVEEIYKFIREDLEDTEINLYNADAQIVFLNWCFSKEDRSFTFTTEGITPFWIIHDTFHAEYDVDAGGQIQVSYEIEKERIYQAIKKVKELGVDNCLTYQLFEEIDNGFFQRFNKHTCFVEDFLDSQSAELEEELDSYE